MLWSTKRLKSWKWSPILWNYPMSSFIWFWKISVDVTWSLSPNRAGGSPSSVKLWGTMYKQSNTDSIITIYSFHSRFLNFENTNFSLGKSASQLTTFFEQHLNPSLLRLCNFNGCYWISADTLIAFLSNCPILVELYVAETELSIKKIGVDILPICPKVTNLSFTLTGGIGLPSLLAQRRTKLPASCWRT